MFGRHALVPGTSVGAVSIPDDIMLWSVRVLIDLRGHGMSTDLDTDFKGVHVHDFDKYVKDVKTLITDFVKPASQNYV